MDQHGSMPISPEVLYDEILSAAKILEKWKARVGDEGIPSVDKPATPEQYDLFIRQLAGELLIVAGKCSNISSIILE